jgi:hypothetical protein
MSRVPLILILIVLGVETLVLGALAFYDRRPDPGQDQTQSNNAQLVQALMLTDLSLWTEARFTRHPSQADCFTPFQNSPGAPDQFPSGTWLNPNRQGPLREAQTPRSK